MEWGCMQALIDFDGWRKWKDFSQKDKEESPKAAGRSFGKSTIAGKREKRASASTLSGGTGSEGLESGREAVKAITAGA